MTPFMVLFCLLLVGSSSYAVGRIHGQLNYRLGYRQGYFDGDRAGWNRRRREAQVAATSAIQAANEARTALVRPGTTYTSGAYAGAVTGGGKHSAMAE
jgi:hypothetical protein